MGTVRGSLSLQSADVFTSSVSITANKNISAGSDDITIYKADDKKIAAYIYVRNLARDLEDYIYIHNSTDTGEVAKIGGGEFCYIPVPHNKTFKAYGTKVNQLIEFVVFGEDDPDTTLG
mgnify:CR=1 FL=1